MMDWRKTQIWKSIFRFGPPKTAKARLLAVAHTFALHLHPTRVPKDSLRLGFTFCLGGISAWLFALLTISGVYLMFYYVPDVGRAYADIQDLGFVVPFGRATRNLHRWAAHLMVVTVILHMARVFFTGSYKPPREMNWVVGVALLTLTLLLSFTGYLLPWDQLAFWAITVGTNMAGAVPGLGHQGPFHALFGSTVDNDVRFVLLGGTQVGQGALLRFYVLHCLALPLLVIALMGLHFWRVRKDGGISRPL